MPELRITRELIDVTTFSEPDPNWVFTDKQGHIHGYEVVRGKVIKEVPSLFVWVEDTPADDEYPAVGHYRCRLCGERIDPKTRSPQFKNLITGLTRYWIDDVELAEAEFRSIMKALGVGEGEGL